MSAPQSILPLEIRRLVFESGDTRLLHDIDVTLSAGRRTIILGPNGAGKSLLLRLCHLVRLLRLNSNSRAPKKQNGEPGTTRAPALPAPSHKPDPQTSPVRRRTTPHRIGTRGVPRCLREPAGQARDE